MPYPNAHKTVGELTKVAVAHMQFEYCLKVLKINDENDIDVSQLDRPGSATIRQIERRGPPHHAQFAASLHKTDYAKMRLTAT